MNVNNTLRVGQVLKTRIHAFKLLLDDSGYNGDEKKSLIIFVIMNFNTHARALGNKYVSYVIGRFVANMMSERTYQMWCTVSISVHIFSVIFILCNK